MLLLLLCLGMTCLQHEAKAEAAAENYEAEYFTNASLPCNFTRHNLSYPGLIAPFKRYWLLPNASIIADNFISDGKYAITATSFGLDLFIAAIDDPDFGVYHCMLLWNNIDYKMDTIRVGLNEDGPYYQQQLEEFERNVIIGCASAGVAVILLIVVFCVCRCRTKKKESEDPYPVRVRTPEVYSVDSKMRHTSQYKYASDAGTGRSMQPHTRVLEPSGHDIEEQYACVNKHRSVRTPATDHVTVQSAHL